MRVANFLSVLMGLGMFSQVGLADDAVIRFSDETAQTTVEGEIKGFEDETYRFTLNAGQKLWVDFKPDNENAYFNLAEAGKEEAMFVGSMSGNQFEGVLDSAGEYEVVVYLMRSAAQRDEVAGFALTVGVGDVAVLDNGETASKLIETPKAGENLWTVDQAVNLRAKPQRGAKVLATLAVGTVVESANCKAGETLSRWCEVQSGAAKGWVWGEYLGAAKTEAVAAVAKPEEDAVTESPRFMATGKVPCAWERGEPMGQCDFGVVRQEAGSADFWIKGSEGQERQIHFDAGIPTFTDAEAAIEASKELDLHMIRIGKERFEIPGAAVTGG